MTVTRESFGAKTTADELVELWKDEIKGKTILMTGASPKSLGAECIYALAAASPKLIIIAGRNLEKIEETSSRISKTYPDVKLRSLELDLASIASCWKAGREILLWEDVPVIDILYNNGAITAGSYRKTADRFEATFGTNYVGHFVFTMAILDKIAAAKTANYSPRIVNVSSAGHRFSNVRFDDPGYQDGKVYDKWQAYGQSKTANMLFSISLVKKLEKLAIFSYSLHPGLIFGTSLTDEFTREELRQLIAEGERLGWIPKTAQEGAATYIVAGFDPEIIDCKITAPLLEYAGDKEGAEKLWKITEGMVGPKFKL